MSRNPVKALARTLLPAESPTGTAVRKIALRQGWICGNPHQQGYLRYIAAVEPYVFYPPLKTSHIEEIPLFSVIIACFNTPDRYLQPLLDSLHSQSFTDWEVIVVDASTDEDASARILARSRDDDRCVYVRADKNRGVLDGTNHGLQHARGKYVVFVGQCDTLSLHALNEMAIAIEDNPSIDILYSDEDQLSEDGRTRQTPVFKPAWSPHLFFHFNYTNHLSVIRRELVEAVDGIRPSFTGAWDYDLLLRIHGLNREIRVHHIPKVLYHSRMVHDSPGRSADAVESGRVAVNEYMACVGLEGGGVENIAGHPGWYRPHPRRKAAVDVVIWVSDNPRLNSHYARLLESRTESSWAVPRFICAESQTSAKDILRTVSETFILIRQPVLPTYLWWLDELVGATALPGTAMVAPLITSLTGETVVCAGMVRDPAKPTSELMRLYKGALTNSDSEDIIGPASISRTVDGLSTAVLVSRGPIADIDTVLAGEYVDGSSVDGLLAVWANVECRVLPLPDRDGALNANIAIGEGETVLRCASKGGEL